MYKFCLLLFVFMLGLLVLPACEKESSQSNPNIENGTPEKAIHLVVYTKDGNKAAYVLKDAPKISFEEGKMVIKTKDVIARYDITNLKRYAYETIETNM